MKFTSEQNMKGWSEMQLTEMSDQYGKKNARGQISNSKKWKMKPFHLKWNTGMQK